ncbi:hypothetical protein ES703_93917 [subsurface metagenome]
MLDCHRIFIADIDYTFCSPGPIGTNYHPFDDAVRVTFQDAPVHIGAGVTLISIAHKELAAVVWLFCQQLPLRAGWKTGTAAAA